MKSSVLHKIALFYKTATWIHVQGPPVFITSGASSSALCWRRQVCSRKQPAGSVCRTTPPFFRLCSQRRLEKPELNANFKSLVCDFVFICCGWKKHTNTHKQDPGGIIMDGSCCSLLHTINICLPLLLFFTFSISNVEYLLGGRCIYTVFLFLVHSHRKQQTNKHQSDAVREKYLGTKRVMRWIYRTQPHYTKRANHIKCLKKKERGTMFLK